MRDMTASTYLESQQRMIEELSSLRMLDASQHYRGMERRNLLTEIDLAMGTRGFTIYSEVPVELSPYHLYTLSDIHHAVVDLPFQDSFPHNWTQAYSFPHVVRDHPYSELAPPIIDIHDPCARIALVRLSDLAKDKSFVLRQLGLIIRLGRSPLSCDALLGEGESSDSPIGFCVSPGDLWSVELTNAIKPTWDEVKTLDVFAAPFDGEPNCVVDPRTDSEVLVGQPSRSLMSEARRLAIDTKLQEVFPKISVRICLEQVDSDNCPRLIYFINGCPDTMEIASMLPRLHPPFLRVGVCFDQGKKVRPWVMPLVS